MTGTVNEGFGVSHALEHAFTRIPRPQKVLDPSKPLVPTKASLLKVRNNSKPREPTILPPTKIIAPPVPEMVVTATPPISAATSDVVTDGTGTKDLISIERQLMGATGPIITLGTFWQDNVAWSVRAQRGRAALMMVKTISIDIGAAEEELLGKLRHRNIAQFVHSSQEHGTISIALEYCRFTLSEILHVHLKLEEPQIQCIARSMFDALKYLDQQGIVHHAVGPSSIRVTTPELRVVLSNFEFAKNYDNSTSNQDLTDLGFVLLDCMEGHTIQPERRNSVSVQEQRRNNRVFGLNNAEHWSGSKQLIDFLDELFCQEKTSITKFSRPHRFVSKHGNCECLRPYLELVTLECFTLWVQGQ